MPLITEVVDAMLAAQERGDKVLAFVVPVTEAALHNCGLAVATIEDRVQGVLIAELKACLGEDHLDREDGEMSLPLWPIAAEEVELIINTLRKSLPTGWETRMLSSSERRRKEAMERLGALMLAREAGEV